MAGKDEFQFLLVRLKGVCARRLIRRSCISIPSGTIKSVHAIDMQTVSVLFQFLLVRLKVSSPFLLASLEKISIPSGTIKRILPYKTSLRRNRISIPSGTIKRVQS